MFDRNGWIECKMRGEREERERVNKGRDNMIIT